MKVLWLTNIPSPYRVGFFNELGKHCELTVLFEKRGSDERDSSWLNFATECFQAVFLEGKSLGVAEAFCPSVIKWINRDYDHIVVTNFSDPTGMLAIATLKAKRISYEIESDGAFAGSGKGPKELLKKWLLSSAKRYFSTADEHDKYYLTYGAVKEQIVRYPFTSLSEKDVLEAPVSDAEKQELRKKLCMNEDKVALAVGQFIHRKGYDVLIKASAYRKDIGVYIVGGTPPKDYLDLAAQCGASNVHFVEFKKKDALAEYYKAADVFIHPTREDIWGLVVNEAMGYGLPVITTDRCIAGGELINSGNCGRIIPSDSVDQLRSAIDSVFESGIDSSKILKRISKYTFNGMVEAHLRAWG